MFIEFVCVGSNLTLAHTKLILTMQTKCGQVYTFIGNGITMNTLHVPYPSI